MSEPEKRNDFFCGALARSVPAFEGLHVPRGAAMIAQRIDGFTRVFGAPKDWKPEDGICSGLPIKDVQTEIGMYMVSAWEPTPTELAALNAGRPVQLWIRGHAHPVVGLTVGE